MFEGILITGGENAEELSAEIFVPSTNVSCNFVRLPRQRRGHSQDGYEVCGGDRNPQTCDTWSTDGTWRTSQSRLLHGRSYHNSWKSREGLVLMGGTSSSQTTELLKPNGTRQSNFPLVYSTMSVTGFVSIVDNFVSGMPVPLPTQRRMKYSSLEERPTR